MLAPENSMSPEFDRGEVKRIQLVLKRNRTEFLMPVEFSSSRKSDNSRIIWSIAVPGKPDLM